MISLWQKNKLAEVNQRENINYWLAITARNAAINHLKAKRKDVLITDKAFFEKQAAKPSLEGAGREADEKIKKIYKLLSPREKLIFKFHFEKEAGLMDISKIMQIPLGTISSAVTRMRKKIKCSKI